MLHKLLLAASVAAATAFAPPLSVRSASVAARAFVVAEEEKKVAKKEKPPPKPRLPGEGDPFSTEAQAYSDLTRDGGETGGAPVYQPRGISDAGVIDVYQ